MGSGAEQPVCFWEEVQYGGGVGALLGAPSEGSSGLVQVDGEDAGAAVAGQYGGQQDRGGGFACTALAIDDCDGSWSWPVLADRQNVRAFRAFCAN